MSTYGLLEFFDESYESEKYKKHKPYEGKSDIYKNKSLFKVQLLISLKKNSYEFTQIQTLG